MSVIANTPNRSSFAMIFTSTRTVGDTGTINSRVFLQARCRSISTVTNALMINF
jgi:hypothetical protein